MDNNVTKEELIDLILEEEWRMFTNVNNVGGRASCQDNPDTFEIMRRSQFDSWSRLLLESYLADIFNAISESRNLLAEKYAYMMQYSFPNEYDELKDSLPKLSDTKKHLIRELTDMQLAWREEGKEKYPNLFGKGRPERIVDELPGFVSFESYTLGELSTMSEMSLNIYKVYAEELKSNGMNMPILILESTVKMYGYASIEDAEQRVGTE